MDRSHAEGDDPRESAVAPPAQESDPARLAGLRRNITLYYLYAFFAMFQLWAPIWVLFMLDRGFSLTQVAVLDMTSFVMIALAEVPTGAVADRWGRKVSMGLGAGLLPVSVVIFGLSHSFVMVFVAWIFYSLAYTLTSGADVAFLYDSLKGLGQEAEFQKTVGKALGLGQISLAASAILGGLLGGIDLVIPVFATAVTLLPALGVILLFTEPYSEHESRPPYLTNVRATISLAGRHSQIRYLILYAAVFFAAMWIVQVFFQPFLKVRGFPVETFGVMYMVFTFATVAGAVAGPRLSAALGERTSFLVIPIVATAALAMLGLVQYAVAFVFLLFVNFTYGAGRPLLDEVINRYTPTEKRATMLSLRSLVSSVVLAPLEPGMGYTADRRGLRSGFFSLAAALILPIAIVLALWRRTQRRADAAPV